ncbi:MAG TPA: lipoyl(octanoyl) transferase LipB [Alphaproteobacteria bacterium]|nr:lipoyl(octanoyl) transferase LipB [Alphaproteobacteria bacterium]
MQTAQKTTSETRPSLMPEWRMTPGITAYPEALRDMEARVTAIESGHAGDLMWLLEHPSLYTAGTSADPNELVDPKRFPVFQTGRGGRYTYHGPGQRVIYAMTDLRARDKDVRQHVWRLEEWIIRTLRDFGIESGRREGRIGIWVDHAGYEKKIAAIGVRVRKWIAYHGLALNVNPELVHYTGIVPCGISEYGVTSMHALGVKASMEDVDAAFRKHADGLIF